MKVRPLAVSVGICFLLILPALAVRPVAATATDGLYAAFWKGTFFGAALPSPSYSSTGCVSKTETATASPSIAPTATMVDPNIAHGAPSFSWMETGFTVGSTTFMNTEFSAEWTGYISLPAGTTNFQLASDDGSWLYIDGVQVINNGDTNPTGFGLGVQNPTSATGSVNLASPGMHLIEVDYYETCDSQSGIDLSWQSPTGGWAIIPASAFTPACVSSNAVHPAPNCPAFPPPAGVPEFGFAAPAVAAVGLLAMVFMRRKTFGRTGTAT